MKDELIERAEIFARRCHAGQTRKGRQGAPYATHLAEVADLVARWGGDKNQVAAAWLHDVIEDCPPTTRAELAYRFGERVADMVTEVSDDKSLPKDVRKRLQIETAPRKSLAAALIKLADLTSNLRSLALDPPLDWSGERQAQYLAWAAKVAANLPLPLPPEASLAYLDAYGVAETAIAKRRLPRRQAQNVALEAARRGAWIRGARSEDLDRALQRYLAEKIPPYVPGQEGSDGRAQGDEDTLWPGDPVDPQKN